MRRENSIRHAAIQPAREEKILKMIRSATNAGGSLTITQIRERIRAYNSDIYKIIKKLLADDLIIVDGRSDFRGVHSIKAKKQAAV